MLQPSLKQPSPGLILQSEHESTRNVSSRHHHRTSDVSCSPRATPSPPCSSWPQRRKGSGEIVQQPGGPGTHSQIQHVHRHRLLRQHLHRGVRVDRDGAAAHCEGTSAGAESGSAGSAARPAPFGGQHIEQHQQPHPQNLHHIPWPKQDLDALKSSRDVFPTKSEAKAGDAPRESE